MKNTNKNTNKAIFTHIKCTTIVFIMTLSLLASHTSITLQYRPLSCFYVLISELLLMKWRKHAENEKLQERRTWAELCELRNRTKVNAIE